MQLYAPAPRRPRRIGTLVASLIVATTTVITAIPAAAATYALSVDDVTVTEDDSGTDLATFTVTLSPAAPHVVTVDVFTANATAVAGSDYAPVSTTLTFPIGVTSLPVDVPVFGDEIDEVNETFILRLANETGVGVVVGDNSGLGIIADDDLAPRLTVDDVAVHEEENAHFTVELFPASSETVTVEFATGNGSATAPDDYESIARLLTFYPGETSETVTVDVRDDDESEDPEETFFVELSRSTGGAVIVDALGMGTIFDDDVLSRLTIDDVEVVEGDSGTRDAVFTVKLFPPSDERVTVEYATENDEAVSPDDYENAAGVLDFSPGETSEQIRVEVRGDEVDERDSDGGDDDDDDDDDDGGTDGEDIKAVREFFTVKLSDAVNAEIMDDEGECAIIDDDALPILNIDDAEVKEGDGGTRGMEFTVRLFPTSEERVTVEWATSDDDAEAPSDYEAARGTLTFQPGEGRRTIKINVKGDALDEPDETLLVLLRDAVNAPIEEDEGEGVIVDDDLAPALTIQDVTVPEGDSGKTTAVLRARLSEPSAQIVTFSVETADDSATTPDDYTATGGTLSIAPGETRIAIEVPVLGDTEAEEEEEFKVEISDIENASPARSTATVVIIEDDVPVAERVDMVANPAGDGYWIVTAEGRVYAFGGAAHHGSLKTPPNQPIVSMAATRSGEGYWLTGSDGGVFAFGDARFLGSTGAIRLNQPIVTMAPTPGGDGYWLVASDGGVFAFGDARFLGSTGAIRLNQPIVDMASTPHGDGYWLVASDGGVFAFGEAGFFGSTGGMRLNRPIVGIAAAPDGRGYWLTASDGGIFSFGSAGFHGSTGALQLNRPIVGMAATPGGNGYWLTASDGGIFTFGSAGFFGSTGGVLLQGA